MAQDSSTQDNVTGVADIALAPSLANPQYGFANRLESLGIRFPDADFFFLGQQSAGTTGTIHIGGALDEISVFVSQQTAIGSTAVLAQGNGIDGQAIFVAQQNVDTFSLSFTITTDAFVTVTVVDQPAGQDVLNGLVEQSVPYVLTSDLAVAQAQSASYRGGSLALTGTSGAAGSFTLDGSATNPSDGQGIGDLIAILGGDAPDVLNGTDVGEVIRGLLGDDRLFGGGGTDLLYGNIGLDLLYGNQGNDTLFGGQDADIAFGGRDNDVVYGNLGNDFAYGNLGDDVLYGGQGEDVLFGGQGDDRLFGNAGNDTMFGNVGADTLTGGGGADRFVLAANQGADIVTDFNIAQGDRVLAFAQNTVAEVNGNVVITAAGGQGSLTLLGVDLATFNNSLPITFG